MRRVPENRTVRRVLVPFVVGFALLIAAFLGTVAILDATLYSAHGFVASYLDALQADQDEFRALTRWSVAAGRPLAFTAPLARR